MAHVFAQHGGANGEAYALALHKLSSHDDPHVAVKALNIIRDYLPWVKTADRLEITGANGGPIEVHDHFALPAPR